MTSKDNIAKFLNEVLRHVKIWKYVLLGMAFILIVWGLWLCYIIYFVKQGKWGDIFAPHSIGAMGQLGDSFAIMNTLFSGFAMLGVFGAIMYQKQEMENQKAQYEEQKTIAEEEKQKQRRQQFETTFFNMLNLSNEIIKGIHITTGPHPETHHNGRDVFSYLKSKLHKMESGNSQCSPQCKVVDIKVVQKICEEFFDQENIILGHYFRTLYAMLKMVECSELTYKSKKSYTNIVRAQLSTAELYILFYNCLWYDEFAPFRLLVEKYAIFEHLTGIDDQQLIWYQSNAYGCHCPDGITPNQFDRNKYISNLPNEKNFIVDEPLS